MSSHFPSSLFSNSQTANRPCEPCSLCFQIPPSVIHPGFSKWHLHSFGRLRVMSTNTGPIPFFVRKLKPGWNISVSWMVTSKLQTQDSTRYCCHRTLLTKVSMMILRKRRRAQRITHENRFCLQSNEDYVDYLLEDQAIYMNFFNWMVKTSREKLLQSYDE